METTETTAHSPYTLWGLSWTTLAAVLLFGTIGSLAQLLNLGLGLIFSEVWIFFGVAYVALRRRGHHPLHDTGITNGTLRDALVGVALGTLNYVFVVAPMSYGATTIADHVVPGLAQKFAMTGLFDHRSVWATLVIVLGAVVAAPFAEEYFFRGLLLRRAIARGARPMRALVVTAFVFSALHMDPVGFVTRFELGFVLGFLFVRTGSLAASMGLHATTNAIACFLVIVVRKYIHEETGGGPSSLASAGLALSVSVVCAVALVRFAASLLPDRWKDKAVDAPALGRVSWLRLALVWSASAIIAYALLVVADIRGAEMNLIDIRYRIPKNGAADEGSRGELETLRERVEAGDVPVRVYAERRRALARTFQKP